MPNNKWKSELKELWDRETERQGQPYLINIEHFVLEKLNELIADIPPLIADEEATVYTSLLKQQLKAKWL